MKNRMHFLGYSFFWVLLGLLCLGASSVSAQGQTVQTTRATELRADKLGNAAVVQTLASGSAVRVISVEGGWVLIETGALPTVSGWVRASAVNLQTAASLVAGLASGREASGNTALTLGVRSLPARVNRHALIIGISRYADAGTPPLPGARVDKQSATQMAQAMQVPQSNIHYLQDEEATGSSIRKALQDMTARVQDGDRVFIHYSGHGTRYNDPVAGGCVEALLAYDGGNITNREMADMLKTITNKTDKLFVMYDACHSGGLVQAASILPSTALELAAVGTPALRVTGILSAVRDLVAQRVVELTATSVPPTSVSWLVLGSSARREAMPGSVIDTALAWRTLPDCRAAELRADADLVLTALERCGISRCPDGANATEPLFSRSVEDWKEATRRWTHHPESNSALLLASIVADNRPLTSVDLGSALTRSMLAPVRDRPFLDGLLSFTLASKPPLGLIHDFAVEHTGAHRGQLDLKRGGLWPVVLLGRWIALVVGDVRGSTVDRVRRGSQAGILTTGEAEDLVGAFEQIFQLRFEQEIAALKSGAPVESHIDPGALDSLQRSYLRDSFRAITGAQGAVRRRWASGAVLPLELP